MRLTLIETPFGYVDIYGLHGIRTMVRATLRNMGWCDCMFSVGKLGLLSLEEVEVRGKTYADFMRDLMKCPASEDPRTAAAAKLSIPRESLPILNLEWLGMFSQLEFSAIARHPLTPWVNGCLKNSLSDPANGTCWCYVTISASNSRMAGASVSFPR